MTAVSWQSPDYEVTFNQDITAGPPVGTTTGTNGNNKATLINAAHNDDPGAAQPDVVTSLALARYHTVPFIIAVSC